MKPYIGVGPTKGFTLIELLIVLAIIAMLYALSGLNVGAASAPRPGGSPASRTGRGAEAAPTFRHSPFAPPRYDNTRLSTYAMLAALLLSALLKAKGAARQSQGVAFADGHVEPVEVVKFCKTVASW